MMRMIYVEGLVKTHQRDLLEASRCWREVSQAKGMKKSKTGTFHRIVTAVRNLVFWPAFTDEYLTHGA
jgi:hypothetical protein